MAPGCSKIGMTSRSRGHRGMAAHPRFFLVASCLLLLSIHVGAIRVGPAISMDELKVDQTSSSRRLLAQSAAPPSNSTGSLLDDAHALLIIKEAISANNVTYWWRSQGKQRALNPCKMLNGTNQFWPGVDCNEGENRRVIAVDLSNMGLNGTVSPVFGTLAHLRFLNLSSNFFSGPIPPELGMATELQTLDLSNNRLEGTLPRTLGDVSNLSTLSLGNNGLGGSIPVELGSLEFLTTLNISGNNLSGSIPVELNSCASLATVDLSSNGLLQGPVPFLNLANLTVLHLHDNQLEGNFVSNLGSFPQLQDVDLSNNSLDGQIPSLIGTLPLRIQLSLRRNKLYGTVPNELGNLALVQIIDLSGNQLTGSLTDQVSRLASLREFDVSENQFSGEFPRNLNSSASLVTINVSHNGFSGSLPALAGLSTLQTFDGSFNNFSGPVLESFVNFTTLKFLNVSNNALSGELPTFVAHDSVNDNSFLNTLLCGTMLRVNCGDPKSSKKIVSISVGSSVAAVAALVLLLLCYRRRKIQKGRGSATVSAELQMELSPEDIMRITDNFAHTIGVGSKSTVYRGVLADATVVAVKRFNIRRGEIDAASDKVLASGFETLGPIRHWASVKVLAYCSSPDIKAVVMEYLPNGTLKSVLHPPMHDSSVVREFNWEQRFDTAMIIAEGLRYLHHECQPSTVHGDLKPSNILFNAFKEPRLTDFALAKIHGLHVGMSAGYTAPEGMPLGGTIKGDVYSFGIVMLELISGRSPMLLELAGQQLRLPQWIRVTISNSKSLQTVLDPVLLSEMRTQQQVIAMVLGVALLCTREDPVERPYISEVLKMLNHIKTRPQMVSQTRSSSVRLRTSLSSHQRNEEIRQEVPGIDIERSPPDTPGSLPTNPSLSHWTPSAHER